ncbi:MAG TPA: 30S ribosomal protein S1 [Nitrospiria bacterium]|nr:30S ribosomal protein S1 [Nitrospiria bacterium]
MARKKEDNVAEKGWSDASVELAELYEESFKNLEEGTIIEGTIVSVQKDGVVVDIGYKSEGILLLEEFSPGEVAKLVVGEKIRVYLEEREDDDGNPILSKDKADKMKVWEDLERAHSDGDIVDGKVISRIKGGMIVDLGVKAFLPGSQIDLRPVKDLDQLIGKTFPMKIIKVDHRRGNVIVSRRILLEEARDKKRQVTLSALQEGQVVDGIVKNITEYGVFIDLGGIDGLLHITDISWGRVNHPSEHFMVGDRVKVTILRYDKETGRVSLGYKQMSPDPWSEIEKKYPIGSRVRGKVVSLADYGAFVELEGGVEGLIHISEMSWSHDVRHPSKIVAVGDIVNTVVLSLDKAERKISLGMRQLEANPWEIIEKRYPVGTKVEGKVRSITEFGVFVGLDNGIDGLIHLSDMSWTRRLTHPSEIFKKGQKVDAVVLKIDKEKERISLGYKQLTPDPWDKEIPEKYKVGDHVNGKVVKIADFGIFVELEDGVDGLIHISEIDLEPSKKIEEKIKANEMVTARIIKADTVERKISLSIKAYKRDVERKDTEEYHKSQGEADMNIGSVASKKKKNDK